MIKLIIYDLDGTLIDSSKDISDSINWMLKELGLAELPEHKIRTHVGSGVVHLIQSVLKEASPGRDVDVFDKAMRLYKSRYSDYLLDKTRLYPGVQETLDFFRGRKQAVMTNKTEEFSRRILKGLGIDHYFFDIIGSDRGLPKKPAPDSVLKLIGSAGVKSNETVLVGDSEIDVQTARSANVQMVAVTYGFSARPELEAAKPDFMIDRFEELKKNAMLLP